MFLDFFSGVLFGTSCSPALAFASALGCLAVACGRPVSAPVGDFFPEIFAGVSGAAVAATYMLFLPGL